MSIIKVAAQGFINLFGLPITIQTILKEKLKASQVNDYREN